MRSPTDTAAADAARVVAEWTARSVAIIALLLAWWSTSRPLPWHSPGHAGSRDGVMTVHDSSGTIDVRAIGDAASNPATRAMHAHLREPPDAERRALLHAALLSGLPVSWRADSATLPAVALAVSALADPTGGTIVRTVAQSGTPLSLSDSVGWLDSATAVRGGVQWNVSGPARAFQVSGARSAATAHPRLGRVRLFAAPGWEARFAMQALEEAGWTVDADFMIAPRVSITAGAPASLDTSRYSAVIAIDSTAWPSGNAIARFVREGGGLVMFGSAASGGALAPMRAGSSASVSPGIPGALRTAMPREGLALRPVTSLATDVVVLERSERPGSPIAMVARRVGLGRVVQVGWEQTWEWRMLGGDDAVESHRDWWRALLQRTAYAPVASGDSLTDRWQPLPGDAAPAADLVARLGPAQAPAELPTTSGPLTPPSPWWFVIAAGALLAEWWSRRLRGAR